MRLTMTQSWGFGPDLHLVRAAVQILGKWSSGGVLWRTAHTGLGRGSESWGCVSRTSQDNSEARQAALRSAHGSDGPGGLKTGARGKDRKREGQMGTESHA